MTDRAIAEQDSLEGLIAALRKKAVCVYLATEGSVAKDIAGSMNEAANTIAKLDAECKRSWEAYHIAVDQATDNGAMLAVANDTLSQMRAENAKLRKAAERGLEWANDAVNESKGPGDPVFENAMTDVRIIEAALTTATEKADDETRT